MVEQPDAGRVYDISPRDREILRPLAGRVAELAARPLEDEKRELWHRHNNLEATRPVIFHDPEHGWVEIIKDEALQCTGALARDWEMRLRKEIFWGESLCDDRVIQPYFDIRHVYEESDWGMKVTRIGGEHGTSYNWDSPLKSYDDLDKLHTPVITVDYDATRRQVELAQQTFGDLLIVRNRTKWWWTLGLTRQASDLRGLQEIMLDMYDHPDELKRLMSILRDGMLARLDFLERNGLLSTNVDGGYVGSGGFGFTKQLPEAKEGEVHPADMWGFCESQETVGVAPEMFGEFVYPFQKPILERFGLNCYGCCEPLHLRWDVVKQVPRLRRVSVSPWADVEKMAEQLGDRYVFSYKPSPSDLAQPVMDEDRVRKVLRSTLEATRGCRLEIIMKDNHTIGNNPRNSIRWVEIAREEVRRAVKA
jgi:hypothetical protein